MRVTDLRRHIRLAAGLPRPARRPRPSGSADGDPGCGTLHRARMSRMAVEMLTDIEKDTIDWDPNS